MLKLPTMSMDIFKNVLGNIDENYPFSMSPKLILALLVLTGIFTIFIGILFIWYKRKTSFTSSTMGNLLKLIPSLKEKIPTLDSLLPILSEQAPSQNSKNAITTIAVPQLLQTLPDECILPPVLVPKLQLEKPTTTSLKEKIPTLDSLLPILSEQAPSQNSKNAITTIAVPQLSQTLPDECILPPVLVPKLQLEKPTTTISVPYHASHMDPMPSTSTDYKSKPLSLEMFNHATTDLNEKGVINLKKYKKYLYKPPHK